MSSEKNAAGLTNDDMERGAKLARENIRRCKEYAAKRTTEQHIQDIAASVQNAHSRVRFNKNREKFPMPLIERIL